MVKILLDQNIPALIEEWLQKIIGKAAIVTSTRTLGFQEISDEEIFSFCQKKQMIIITYDEDFQNPLMLKNIPGYGVVRLNIYPTGYRQTQDAIERLLKHYPVKSWEKASIVIDKHKIRYQKK